MAERWSDGWHTERLPEQPVTNPPRGWREATDGTLACPHRDLSVCEPCASEYPECVDVYGAHFWVPVEEARMTDEERRAVIDRAYGIKRTVVHTRAGDAGALESTQAYMQRTDPVGYQECRDAGRF